MWSGCSITKRLSELKMNAAERYKISPEKCHVGHVALEGMLESPDMLHQIDGATDTSETNLSVATRSMRLASAMHKLGLRPGDAVVIMGPNHLDLAIPFYACHFNGYSMCSMDKSVDPSDLQTLFPNVQPKIVFCQKNCVEKIKEAFEINIMEIPPIVTFDSQENNLVAFVDKYKGTEINFSPAVFDTSDTAAWLMLTSGTTGVSKVAIMTFDTLYNGVIEWWTPIKYNIGMTLTMNSTQWLSSLMFYISTTLKPFTRLQSSQPLTPQLTVTLINKYKPNATAWTPFLLSQFILAAENYCDLSSLTHILIGGSAMEKPLLDKFKERCNAILHLAYGMTELLVPVFKYSEDTPFGAAGKPFEKYKYRLVDDDDKVLEVSFKSGELWIKGDAFFKGYLNNPEETRKILTEDGWIKTGDIFYKDDYDYFFFVERKKLLIRYLTSWISPLQLEEIIKRHPGVMEACVIGLPNAKTMELPVAAIMKKAGIEVKPQDIFELIKNALPEYKHLHGGLFFVDSFPETPSGKVHRSKVVEMARTTQAILPK